MIKVYQSDTGQFVLVHPPSQSFIIESSLEAGYAKLEEHLKAHHPEMVGKVLEPIEKPVETGGHSRIAHLILLIFLALLPFVWLLVLNHSLATLITDIRVENGGDTGEAADYGYLREDVDLLRLEQNRVLQALHSLSQSVESLTVKLEALEAPATVDDPSDPSEATEGSEASEAMEEAEAEDEADAVGSPEAEADAADDASDE